MNFRKISREINANILSAIYNTKTISRFFFQDGERFFKINSQTGEISTKMVFDREAKGAYALEVEARDGAPSARPNSGGQPNSVTKYIRIGIADKNDNPPYFDKHLYEAEVDENEDIQHTVLTVTANDKDESSRIRYEITRGNFGGAFAVKNMTGAIYVAGQLDYETRKRVSITLKTLWNVWNSRNIRIFRNFCF